MAAVELAAGGGDLRPPPPPDPASPAPDLPVLRRACSMVRPRRRRAARSHGASPSRRAYCEVPWRVPGAGSAPRPPRLGSGPLRPAARGGDGWRRLGSGTSAPCCRGLAAGGRASGAALLRADPLRRGCCGMSIHGPLLVTGLIGPLYRQAEARALRVPAGRVCTAAGGGYPPLHRQAKDCVPSRPAGRVSYLLLCRCLGRCRHFIRQPQAGPQIEVMLSCTLLFERGFRAQSASARSTIVVGWPWLLRAWRSLAKAAPIHVGDDDGDGHDNCRLNPLGGVVVKTSSATTTQRPPGENPVRRYRTSDDGHLRRHSPTCIAYPHASLRRSLIWPTLW
ncbi:hypothetical protein U9M48_038974 [Paspalum notatum var. saurae]|uniref:Uncharacterized protein n=1 Tax=Paspalum notatum var. saurae TaxID=547442 RepID=A0AAQ3UJP1_PASNO